MKLRNIFSLILIVLAINTSVHAGNICYTRQFGMYSDAKQYCPDVCLRQPQMFGGTWDGNYAQSDPNCNGHSSCGCH